MTLITSDGLDDSDGLIVLIRQVNQKGEGGYVSTPSVNEKAYRKAPVDPVFRVSPKPFGKFRHPLNRDKPLAFDITLWT